MTHDEKTSIVPYKGTRSVDEIQKRRAKIMEIKDKLMTDLGHAHQEDIIQELGKIYGIHITKRTLQRDLKAINRVNTFVLDISQHNYSAIVEECYNTFLEIVRHATLIEGQRWKVIKKTRTVKERSGGRGPKIITKEQIIDQGIRPNLKALALKLKVTTAMMNLLQGNNVDTQVGMISREFAKIQKQKQELEEEHERLQNEKVLNT